MIYIICPECGEICKLIFNDFKITLYGCKNDHIKNNITLGQFNETQKFSIKCIYCNTNSERNIKNDNTQFFNCLTCNKNICKSCKNNHNEKHNIIEYKLKNYICNIYNNQFNSYCNKCKKNLCLICEKEHKNENDITYFKDMLYNINNIKNNELKFQFEKFNNDIIKIIEILNNVKNEIGIFYKFYYDIMNNFNTKNVNYQILNNINEISDYNKIVINEINKVIDEVNINKKFNNIINLYDKLFETDKTDKNIINN